MATYTCTTWTTPPKTSPDAAIDALETQIETITTGTKYHWETKIVQNGSEWYGMLIYTAED